MGPRVFPPRASLPLPLAREEYSRDILPKRSDLVETPAETTTTTNPTNDASVETV
jgi:hypothetical protein